MPYNAKDNEKRKYKEFHILDEVMVDLSKERFQVGAYNKSKMKKFGACKIVQRHDSRNTYEVELPTELNISSVFIISNLTKYHEGGDGDVVIEAQWSVPTAISTTKEIEDILDN